MEKFIVTIARGFGSGGGVIGQKLADRLGIPCYSREILTMASEKSGISEAIFAQNDEKLRGSLLINEIRNIPREKALSPYDKDFVSDSNIFALQSEIIRSLADTESCVIIGKCADHVLREYKNVLNVYVNADRTSCVEAIVERMCVSNKEANRLIERTDKYRSDYYTFYTEGKEWQDPLNYHLFLNSSKLGWDKCVDILEDTIKNFVK